MNKNREKAMHLLLDSEGSELNVSPNEPGGASKFGVSVDALTDYYKMIKRGRAATVDDVSNVTFELAVVVYGALFADRVRFDDLPSGVDYLMLNNCANLGVSGGIRLAQVAFGAWNAVGIMDDGTVTLLSENPEITIHSLTAAWLAKKFQSPHWGPSSVTKNGYGHGWTNRALRVREDALKMMRGE